MIFFKRSGLLLATLVSSSAAIDLLGVLQTYPALSDLYGFVNASANATALLSSANNFTFFAPNAAAIQSLITNNPNALLGDSLIALLQYSLIQGGYPTLSFSNQSQFVPTKLNNASYANVTGGQVVELVLDDDGKANVLSGNKTVSASPTTEVICVGGIVHIVDTVLSIPIQAVGEITAAGLEYVISILNIGGYLSTPSKAAYVNAILEVPDVTYFLPNSAAALANATAIVQNSTDAELQALLEYHVVPGYVGYSTDLKNGQSLKTAQGDNVNITIQDGDTYVNAVKIISSDWIVANGVVHVIDSLLNRSDTSPPPVPVSTSSTSSSTSSPTPSPTPKSIETTALTPTASPSGGGGGLSTGAKIGIGIGVAIVGLLVLGAVGGFFLRDRRQKRESGTWGGTQDMSGVPGNATGKYYVKRGTIHKQEDMGLGLGSTGMHDIQQDNRPVSPPYTGYSATVTGPEIPARSPSRTMRGWPDSPTRRNEF